jgi:hypothetical protein
MPEVISLPTSAPRITIENDEGLLNLVQRTVSEIYMGNEHEFEEAFSEALAQQIVELSDVNDGFGVNLAEELADAMRGVLLQWLGEHTCCPREDMPVFLARISQGRS